MLLVNKKRQLLLELPLENKIYLYIHILFIGVILPVAFEANGNRHSPGGNRLSNNGQAQIH